MKPSRLLDLTEFERPSLEGALAERGYEPFRGRQIFHWLYCRGVADFHSMSDLPQQLRAGLASEFTVLTPQIGQRDRSKDGTEKFLLRLEDGQLIESVFIPDTPAMTFCLSTQAGCAMACAFCLTGRMGLTRNLTAGEIVSQVRVLAQALGFVGKTFNLVFMGMGEPLHNYDETMKAVRILCDPEGMRVPTRRITISTVGLLPALKRLAQEPLMPNLAVSLHAPSDQQRQKLVPLTRKYGVAEIIEACRAFPLKKRSRITFEYVLLAGVNDRTEDVKALGTLLRGMKAKVNVIPLNEAAGIAFRRPSDTAIDRFARGLAAQGLTVSVRKSRGRDIRAACGQLIVEGPRPSPAQQLAGVM